MTGLDLDAIERRINAAASGPWWNDEHEIHQGAPDDVDPLWIGETCNIDLLDCGTANAVFIAHARQDLPELVAEVRRLRGLLEAAYCRLHYVGARLERVDVRDDPTGFAGDVGPYLDGPLHPQDLADYRNVAVERGREWGAG